MDSSIAGVSRTDKTLDKLRRGGLPLCPVDLRADLKSGDGQACDGCSEAIDHAQRMYAVEIHDVILRFHLVCYNAWGTFER